MKKFEYIPQLVKKKMVEVDGAMVMEETKDLVFSGFVTINVPREDERLAYVKELQLEMSQLKDLPEEEINIKRSMKLKEMARKAILAVELIHIESELRIVDVEDLFYSKEGADLVDEIGTICIQGINLGNVRKKK